MYLSKADADYLTRNSIWVSYAKKPELEAIKGGRRLLTMEEIEYFDCKYAFLEGKFNKDEGCHLDSCDGALENVTRVLEIVQYYDGKQEVK